VPGIMSRKLLFVPRGFSVLDNRCQVRSSPRKLVRLFCWAFDERLWRETTCKTFGQLWLSCSTKKAIQPHQSKSPILAFSDSQNTRLDGQTSMIWRRDKQSFEFQVERVTSRQSLLCCCSNNS